MAAGSEARDAGNRSPARVKEAITVGSSNFLDARLAGSNFNDVVNLYAPGYEITSCGYNDDTVSLLGYCFGQHPARCTT